MKLLFVLLITFFSTFYAAAQTIYRCNNDPSVPTSATLMRTLQDAHDAASSGDIIYVEPSFGGTSYGNLNLTKTLTIIGNGYDHSVNAGVNQNWDTRPSIVGTINLTSTTGGGSIFQGLSLGGGSISVKVPNVTIQRCKSLNVYLYRELTKNSSGANILQNHTINVQMSSVSDYTGGCYTPYHVENIVMKNNINFWMSSSTLLSGCGSGVVTIPCAKDCIITNNVYYTGSNINNCMNCSIYNNIFRNIPVSGIINNLATGSAIGNNVCGTNPCVQGSNNIDSATDNQLFVVANPFSNDKDFILKAGSVAIGAGLGGVDAGAFGTTTPYVLSGLPSVPQITSYSFNSSAGVYTTSTPMTITLSIRGNN